MPCCCYAAATASGLQQLPLEALTELTVEYTKTIGPDLSFLDRCSSLEHLALRLAGVTDDQLHHVGQLAGLRHLLRVVALCAGDDLLTGPLEQTIEDGPLQGHPLLRFGQRNL